jgi:adenosylcobinamide-phosphate synthase
MAGALGLSLGGPRTYDGELIEDATMGNGRWDASAADIRRALVLYRRADAILIGLIAVLAALIFIAPL